MHKRVLVLTAVISSMALFACTGEIIRQFNQVTRTDVPKQRLHVLKFPSLEKVIEKDTCANVTVRLKQIPDSLQFCATDGYEGKPYYYQLDAKDWKLSLLDSPPALKNGENGLPIEQRFRAELDLASKTGNDFQIYDCDRLINKVPSALPYTNSNPPDSFHFFNNGRSLAYASGRDGAPWSDVNVIEDIAHARADNYQGTDYVVGIFGDPSADCFFYTHGDKQGNYFVDKFEHGKLLRNFAVLGRMPRANFTNAAYDKQCNRIVITLAYPVPALIVVNATTGKIQTKFDLSEGLASSSLTFLGKVGNTYLALLGPKLIDLQSVKAVASLPYSSDPAKSLDADVTPLAKIPVGVGETAIAKDNRTLLYVGYDYNDSSTIKLVSYDLLEQKVNRTVSLSGPWKPGYPTVFSITFAPDGNVLVLSGTSAVFLDHAHEFH